MSTPTNTPQVPRPTALSPAALPPGADPNPNPDYDYRTALSRAALKRAFLDNLLYVQGKFPALATTHDYYMALAYTVRDRIMQRWISTPSAYTHHGSRTVCYLSAEFLMGPHLGNNLLNLAVQTEVAAAVSELGLDLETLLAQESELGLGNGGLGRLAACFLDSLATRQIPALGYGIRYEFGIFQQHIVGGAQHDATDKWLAIVGSHAINGVAGLHTELLRTELLADFCELWPGKLSNKTNGVTPRRRMQLANPGLTRLLTATLGEGWTRDLGELAGLAAHATDAGASSNGSV